MGLPIITPKAAASSRSTLLAMKLLVSTHLEPWANIVSSVLQHLSLSLSLLSLSSPLSLLLSLSFPLLSLSLSLSLSRSLLYLSLPLFFTHHEQDALTQFVG